MILSLQTRSSLAAIALACICASAPAMARDQNVAASDADELPAYLQCVPFAREASGIRIFGDAHTWWDQADGRYARGNTPKPGAVMAFEPTERMPLGHVAAVAQVLDSRTVLLDHANWSPINGRRGQIERGVRAIDVSPGNDWSEVRVWYHPLQDLGTTAWPVHGFIYGQGGMQRVPDRRQSAPPAPVQVAVSKTPSRDFLDNFSDLGRAQPRKQAVQRIAAVRPVKPQQQPQQRDPLDAVLARYE
jgi:surface antigen